MLDVVKGLNKLQTVVYDILPSGAGKRCSECGVLILLLSLHVPCSVLKRELLICVIQILGGLVAQRVDGGRC